MVSVLLDFQHRKVGEFCVELGVGKFEAETRPHLGVGVTDGFHVPLLTCHLRLNKEVVLVAMGVKPEYYLESLIPPWGGSKPDHNRW